MDSNDFFPLPSLSTSAVAILRSTSVGAITGSRAFKGSKKKTNKHNSQIWICLVLKCNTRESPCIVNLKEKMKMWLCCIYHCLFISLNSVGSFWAQYFVEGWNNWCDHVDKRKRTVGKMKWLHLNVLSIAIPWPHFFQFSATALKAFAI